MPNRLSLPSSTILLFACGLLALPAPAFAGFEWVAPADTAMAPPSVQTWPAAPVARAPSPATATAAPEIISPVIIGGSNPTPIVSAPPSPSSSLPSSGVGAAPLDSSSGTLAGAPVIGGKAPSAMASAPVVTLSTSPSADVVHGFAKQVPLAVALRQILPPGYGFSVDPDVDLGVLISFQGGKPWRDTLRDALEPAGLAMREQGQMVSVGHAAPMAMTEAVPAPAPMPQMPAPHIVDMAPGAAQPLASQTEEKSPTVEEWHAERGDNLHKIIEAWAQRAHVELNWEAEYDYPLQASFSYTGTFEEAVRNLLTGFEDAHPQPIAELHSNPSLGLRVLIVQTRGNSYGD